MTGAGSPPAGWPAVDRALGLGGLVGRSQLPTDRALRWSGRRPCSGWRRRPIQLQASPSSSEPTDKIAMAPATPANAAGPRHHHRRVDELLRAGVDQHVIAGADPRRWRCRPRSCSASPCRPGWHTPAVPPPAPAPASATVTMRSSGLDLHVVTRKVLVDFGELAFPDAGLGPGHHPAGCRIRATPAVLPQTPPPVALLMFSVGFASTRCRPRALVWA